MKEIIRGIKRLFGIYETGYEYWVSLDEIHIQPSFAATRIGSVKLKRKWAYYLRNGECESLIVLTKDFVLVDGYSSYLIYKRVDPNCKIKVPIVFTNK